MTSGIGMDFDLLDVDLYVDGDPETVFRTLRAKLPVYWQDHPGFFAVTTHAGVGDALRAVDAFSSAAGTDLEDMPDDWPRAILHMDPPRHTKVRKLLGPEFAPRSMAALEEQIRGIVRELLDTIPFGDEFDFAASIADRLPMLVIGRLIGIPEADDERFKEWNTVSIVEEPFGPVVRGIVADMIDYFSWLRARRLEDPQDDIVTRLAQACIDGEPLDDVEFFGNLRTLMTGGQDTTSNLISGGVLELVRHPDAWTALQRDAALLPVAIEEMIRYVPQVMYLARRARVDVTIEGTTIPAGSKVALFFVSANRDELAFDIPSRFDFRRSPNPHLGFGFGRHFCIGAPLARLEARIMFEELLQAITQIDVHDVHRLRSNIFPGIDRLRVVALPV